MFNGLQLQNIFNFLFNTSGVDLRVLAAEDKQKEVSGSPLMRFVGQDLSGSSGPNTIEGIMNGVIKEKLKIIPNNLVWAWTIARYIFDCLFIVKFITVSCNNHTL